VTYNPPSEADKAAWRWYEIDRSDDSGVALDELLDIAEAAIKKRDEGAE
jgi:hypothetical protein